MSLLQTIKAAQLQSRKDRNQPKTGALTTLIGDAEIIGKNAGRETTDVEVVATLKKFIKNLELTISAVETQASADPTAERMAKSQPLYEERALYQSFLPKQIEGADLRSLITTTIATLALQGPKAVGQVMKHLKENFEGQYDGGEANKIAREILV